MRWPERPWRWIAGRSTLASRAPRIALAYAIFATAWIYFSDRAILFLARDPEVVVELSVYKGIAFVALTAVLLLLVMLRAFRAIEGGYLALQEKERRLRDSREELAAASRMNAVLSLIDQTLVRVPDREEAFDRVCNVLAREGGYALAWIGWRKAGDRVIPVALAGEADAQLRGAIAGADPGAQASEPAAIAVREGRPHVCGDIAAEPPSAWRDAALRAGIGSVAAFPIHDGPHVVGALAVASAEARHFRPRELAGFVGAAEDLSFAIENRQREEERRRVQALAQAEREFSLAMIESMPGIVYFYDEHGRFLRWNGNFARVSGYTNEEIARMHPLDFFRGEDRARVEARIAEVFASGDAFVEANFVARDGRATPYLLTGRRIEHDGRSWLVGVGIDISKRKAAENALREANTTLEQKVAERTAELSEARVRAESADRLKSAFLATMSHELRTPLNSIIGFTGIVLKGMAGPLTKEQAHQLGIVRASARHLLELVNDVLDLSKIEAGQLEVRVEPFDLRASVEKVIGVVRPLAEKKGLALTARTDAAPPVLRSDRRRVEQILLNLLGNAVKFTERGSVALVVERVAADRGTSAVCMRVSDTGIGVRAGDLDEIFKPFRQADHGLARQHEGTGLGLAICRRLAGLLGGEVTARSEPGRGSEFRLTLPQDPEGAR